MTQLIVLTGGPGAGKTAVLEMIKSYLCKHVAILPEAASIVFGGGFWRHPSDSARRAAQRAIYHVQRESERLVLEEGDAQLILCDRGSIDGLAYWPGNQADFWRDVGSSYESELGRYTQVIHLRTPGPRQGYNHKNHVRIESAEEALAVDARIEEVWRRHPHRHIIASTDSFVTKAQNTIDLILKLAPKQCCR